MLFRHSWDFGWTFYCIKTVLLDNGKDVLFLSHVQLMCSMIYENCVNRVQKSHLRLFSFYTTNSCVSLHFWCLSSIFFFSSYFLVQFHFPIGEKCRHVLHIRNFFPSILYVRYNQQCASHQTNTIITYCCSFHLSTGITTSIGVQVCDLDNIIHIASCTSLLEQIDCSSFFSIDMWNKEIEFSMQKWQ